MTERLYYEDAYLKQFEAQVTAHREKGLILDRTAFYPGGGGQPADQGTLYEESTKLPVVKVKASGDEVNHWISLDAAQRMPPVGASLRGELDWKRRFQLMRTHTALHILCGVIWRDYGAQVTGGNMTPLQARMDFELEHMSADFASQVEVKINAEVAAGRDVHVSILPREEAFQIPDLIRTKINLLPPQITQVRIVEIEGLDLQADGGTHVANTAEVGQIRVVKHESKGRINKRLRIALDG